MSGMKNPAESFGQIIAGIDNPRDEFHDNLLRSLPFLDDEMLDLDVMDTSSGPVFVDHCNGINHNER